MTHLISLMGGFVIGVVEHPKSDTCVKGVPGALAKGGSHAVFHVPILDPSPVPLLTAPLGNLMACRIGQRESLTVLGT